ncbi:MAG: hypothetical protein ACR2MX_01665 [Cyclobacteriaceae bacterium]
MNKKLIKPGQKLIFNDDGEKIRTKAKIHPYPMNGRLAIVLEDIPGYVYLDDVEIDDSENHDYGKFLVVEYLNNELWIGRKLDEIRKLNISFCNCIDNDEKAGEVFIKRHQAIELIQHISILFEIEPHEIDVIAEILEREE